MIRSLSTLLSVLLVATFAGAETVSLAPSSDTGLFQFAPDNNLGSTEALQIGTNGQGTFGRGLFRFDIAGNLPAGARVDSVSVSFGVTAAGEGAVPTNHDLYRIQLDWQEGNGTGGQGSAAEEGQTTWDARFHGIGQWTVPGGAPGTDFASAPSATTTLGGLGAHTFSNAQDLVDDVQGWLDDPSCNFGWVLVSQSEGDASSTRRIASRESPTLRPQLTVEYTPLRITEIEHGSDQSTIDWQGGMPPFVIERAPTPGTENWAQIGTSNTPPFELPTPVGREFFRVREAAATSTARYRITWKATWSVGTHPANFPGGAHFSDLYGATHNGDASLWEPGGLATTGIKNMAERGSNSALRSEIQTAMSTGSVESLLDGNTIRSPGQTSLEFEISQSHQLVTFVCMIAPSPDWFVGVHGLPLFENGRWLDRKTVALQAYDAGTDSGTNYTSGNSATNPPQPISQITPRGETRPFGTFTFERIE